MITLDEARANVGNLVVYRGGHPNAEPEQGVITSVNDRYVFVRYGATVGSQATYPRDLDLLHRGRTS